MVEFIAAPRSGGLRSSSWSGVLGGLGGKVKSLFFVRGPQMQCCWVGWSTGGLQGFSEGGWVGPAVELSLFDGAQDKGVSLNDCLRRYCAPEYLTGKVPIQTLFASFDLAHQSAFCTASGCIALNTDCFTCIIEFSQ